MNHCGRRHCGLPIKTSGARRIRAHPLNAKSSLCHRELPHLYNQLEQIRTGSEQSADRDRAFVAGRFLTQRRAVCVEFRLLAAPAMSRSDTNVCASLICVRSKCTATTIPRVGLPPGPRNPECSLDQNDRSYRRYKSYIFIASLATRSALFAVR